MVVEGETEEAFVNGVLAESLWPFDVDLTPIRLGVPGHRGGRPNYARLEKDLQTYLKQESGTYCSSMLDFYGLGDNFPGMPVPPGLSGAAKAEHIERAIKADFCQRFPALRPDLRLIPYIQLHEYEGLLFSDPAAFADAISRPALTGAFEGIRALFETPEDINDDSATAPSKRVLAVHPSYRKVLHGTQAARAVGIDKMLEELPAFRNWIERLKALTAFI